MPERTRRWKCSRRDAKGRESLDVRFVRQISAHRGPQTQPQPLSLNPLTVSPSRASDALAALDFRPMSVEEVELKSWTASRIGELTQTRESDCLEIAECILGFDDPHVLKAGSKGPRSTWRKPFTWHFIEIS